MRFEFSAATRIIFGPGTAREAVAAAVSLGDRALVVTGSTPGRLDSFVRELNSRHVECVRFPTSGEPTIDAILEGVRIFREARCNLVVGCGGGSALDGAKAIAGLATNPGAPLDYLEVVGGGKPLAQPGAPCICMPTTAGTGCEVTRNAVLISPEHRVKVSLRSNWMFPHLAVVDPELTYSLPPDITAATGMDALTQLIEPFVCIRANPMTDALCRDGIRRVAQWRQRAVADGANAEARENMALASLFGGLALTNAGLGAVHGFAAPMGGMFPIPHGVACACLLPFVMEANLKALSNRPAESDALARYDEIARVVTGNPDAKAEAAVGWIHMLRTKLSIPSLAGFGITEKDIPAIAGQADKSSSIKGNPIKLTQEELTGILRSALGGQ